MIEEGYVTVNQEKVKANYKCQIGDVVEWSVPEPKPLEVEAENIPLDIVYEDADVVVVNKSKGMVVHPSAGHHCRFHCIPDSLRDQRDKELRPSPLDRPRTNNQ